MLRSRLLDKLKFSPAYVSWFNSIIMYYGYQEGFKRTQKSRRLSRCFITRNWLLHSFHEVSRHHTRREWDLRKILTQAYVILSLSYSALVFSATYMYIPRH